MCSSCGGPAMKRTGRPPAQYRSPLKADCGRRFSPCVHPRVGRRREESRALTLSPQGFTECVERAARSRERVQPFLEHRSKRAKVFGNLAGLWTGHHQEGWRQGVEDGCCAVLRPGQTSAGHLKWSLRKAAGQPTGSPGNHSPYCAGRGPLCRCFCEDAYAS